MDAQSLAARFERDAPITFGVEEEFMLLDPGTLDLSPRAAELLERSLAPPEARLELPASQLELATSPVPSIDRLDDQIHAHRRSVARALGPEARAASAGTHPFAAVAGALNRSVRYTHLHDAYGWVAKRQLICGMHVHVALGGAARTLAVYNALRAHLPDLAALGANAPYYAGEDTGMASVRPLVNAMLPRQGVPPVLESWAHYASELRWARDGGRLNSTREWWWELRPHAHLGTLETRVLDAQTTPDEASALAAATAALTVWLSERYDAGDLPRVADSWRIAENRWSAARHGLEATMVDVHSGRREAVRDRLERLLDEVEGCASDVGATRQLVRARKMVSENGAVRQRRIGAETGARGLVRWLADRF